MTIRITMEIVTSLQGPRSDTNVKEDGATLAEYAMAMAEMKLVTQRMLANFGKMHKMR